MITKADKALVKAAVENFKLAQQAYAKQRKQAREDLQFLAGEQTPAGEAAFPVNLLNPFMRTLVATLREANPSIDVVPNGSGADQDIADVYSGLIRATEQKCDAQLAYLTAMWYAAAAGEGYVELTTDYVDASSFDQELTINTIQNPEMVFLDPNHTLVDGCDSEFGFVIKDLSHDTYKRMYPKSELAKQLNGKGWTYLSLPKDWLNDKTIRVAKYYYKTYADKTIYLYEDPVSLQTTSSDLKPDEFLADPLHNGLQPVRDYRGNPLKRTTHEVTVNLAVLTCYEVLDETTVPGTYIPLVKFTGDCYYVGGERKQHGAIRFAKDPQKQFNFAHTKKVQLLDQIPLVPFVAEEGQVVNNPDQWATAHRIAYGTLTYKGTGAPPPTRPPGVDATAIGALQAAAMDSLEHIKMVFGMHGNPMLDQAVNDTSGVALDIRDKNSGKGTAHYFDNAITALKCLGRIMVQWIPIVYDTDRIIRIVKPDTTEKMVAINSVKNKQRYDLTRGTYDVSIRVGPAYTTKREKSLETVIQALPLLPEPQRALISDQVLNLIEDSAVRPMVARIKASQPKEVLAASGELDSADELAPAELLQQTQQELAQVMQQLKLKDLENQELQTKVKIAEDTTALELVKHDAEIQHKTAELQHQDEKAELEGYLKKEEIALTKKKLELEERKIAIEEQKLDLARTLGADKILEGMRPTGSTDIPDTNIGGDVGH